MKKPSFLKPIRAGLAVGIAAMVALSGAAPASADGESLVIRKVSTANFPKVEMTLLKPTTATAGDAITVTENGKAITNPNVSTIGDANVPVGVALLLDTSAEAGSSDALSKEKAAAIAMVQNKTPNQKFAIIATNGAARLVVNFTDNQQLLVNGINTLQASGDSVLWNSLSMAAAIFQAAPELQPNVVSLTTTKDAASTVSAEAVRSSLRTSNTVFFPVAIQQAGAELNVDTLKSLAAETGGRFYTTTDPAAATQLLTGLEKNLQDQMVVSYQSPSNKTSINIEVTVAGATATAHTSPNTVAEGSAVNPATVASAKLPAPFNGKIGLLIIAFVSLLFVALLLYGIIEIASDRKNNLSRALRPYSDEPLEERDFSKLADSDIIKKAVAETGRIADERGLLEVVQRRLEQADLPLKPAEAIFFTGIAAIIAMIIGALLFDFIGLGIAGLVFAYMPIAITNMKASRRRKKFTAQLPDTLQLLAGSLRAGYSLVQGMDAVAKQVEAPMGTELQRAIAEARLGRPIEEALQEVSDRMGSDDFEWAVMAIKIQREVGGNLAELLITVADTMVERERLRREVKALTAEGRISAIILVALPPGIGVLVSIMNPAYMGPLLHQTLGQIALVAAGVMMLIGYWLMNKMIQVEV